MNKYLPSLESALKDALTWGDCSDEGFVEAYVLAVEVKRLQEVEWRMNGLEK